MIRATHDVWLITGVSGIAIACYGRFERTAR
jgi:hypothetical protein